eukprot:121927-Pelagomonas_calceolata.AAC.1
MGGSPLDRAHEYGIGTALMPAKGPVPWESPGMSLAMFSGTLMLCSWSLSLQQASMAKRNKPCAPLLRASQQRLRAVLCPFMNISGQVGCEHPRTT